MKKLKELWRKQKGVIISVGLLAAVTAVYYTVTKQAFKTVLDGYQMDVIDVNTYTETKLVDTQLSNEKEEEA